MTTKELKSKYLDFFKEKGHEIIPSASLVPQEDPTVLFTTAGMHPLVPYLVGEKHPGGKRLANVQKCIRTGDIEEVGDNTHLTFFEMLGNWSLGDYWKEEAISWSFEFLTDKKWLNIPAEKLYITVFSGDQDAPEDEESIKIWQEQFQETGIEAKRGERIFPLPKEDNWWGPAGQTGPCGPCTEMFYDVGKDKCSEKCQPGCACGKYVEIWNDVFMEYNKTVDGKYEKLKQKNVDTGMGVERTTAILNGKDNVYETEVFFPITEAIGKLAKVDYISDSKSYRIISDHLKAAVFILGDENGVAPSNVEQGYVLRRLIRRAIRFGKQIGIAEMFTFKIAEEIVKIYRESFPELNKNKDFIVQELFKEEEKFKDALDKGLKKFNDFVLRKESKGRSGRVGAAHDQSELYGSDAFFLYQTYGFPKEMMQELCKENNIKFDEGGFEEELKKHQELSRAGAEKKFKGGLGDHSEQTTKLHTATHLLQAALRKVLGEHVFQKGSNITAERLRFDFTHDKKISKEEIKKVEELVNEHIQNDLPVEMQEMTVEEAKKEGALGIFESKYGEKVKVYSINGFSKEICGGPHIGRTGDLGRFRIVKEEASSAGVRRIKAVLE